MALVSEALLEILLCPETRSRLTLADDRMMERLNAAIAARQLVNRGGDKLEKPLDGGLLRGDRTVLYPIVDGIPIMLLDESIPLAQLEGQSS
jgi:uncharacterized protein YbaR (Trm112 family)